jgi:hypothetical protein
VSGVTPSVKRCPETRAHYAHEWYNPLRHQCPGGPDETTATRQAAADAVLAEAHRLASAHHVASNEHGRIVALGERLAAAARGGQ